MKNNKKILKKMLSFVLMLAIIVTSIMKVNAESDTITLGEAHKTKSYIAGVTFSYKMTKDGKYLYCLNIHKKTAQNTKAKLVKNSKYVDGGLVYILKNGYPNKSITGDKDKDYYITQTAVWWYLDKTKGTSNLGDQFKKSGSDSHNLRKYVKNLVEEGYAHRNDSLEYSDAQLEISAIGNNTMTLKDDYYISNDIKATSVKNVNEYKVTLENAPEGTKIVTTNGEVTYNGEFVVKANESFKVKVPASSLSNTETSIKVIAKANGTDGYMAYEYQPTNSKMQNVALLEKQQSTTSSECTLEIASSKVTVIKVDANTKQPIADAELELRDSNDNVVTTWKSTINAHIIKNLPNGDYTIVETNPPKGYILNKKETKFTVSDKDREIKITIENAPKNVVVNITKVDQETNTSLAGAVLVVKDSNGNVVERFETTTESEVLTDLADGTYTVEEEKAPEGYITSNEKITFTVDENHLSHQITFVNAKEVYVPDTASVPSVVMFIIGILISGIGIRYIYKNGQRA